MYGQAAALVWWWCLTAASGRFTTVLAIEWLLVSVFVFQVGSADASVLFILQVGYLWHCQGVHEVMA